MGGAPLSLEKLAEKTPHPLSFSGGRRLLDVQFIASLKSNLCTALTGWNITENPLSLNIINPP